MTEKTPQYTTSTPTTAAAFRNRPCALPFSDLDYKSPTNKDLAALAALAGWNHDDIIKITNCNNPVFSYAAWRLLLLEAGIVAPKNTVITAPDAKEHNPNENYLRELIERSGLSVTACAKRCGYNKGNFIKLLDSREPELKAAYSVQFCLEVLALKLD